MYAHPDDAVFGASHALVNAKGVGTDVVVCGAPPATMSPANWDRDSGFTSARTAWYVRQREHEQVCESLQLRSTRFPFADLEYKSSGRPPWQGLETLREFLKRYRPDAIFTHRPDAHHQDHRKVAAMAIQIGKALSIRVVVTCDRPYFICRAGACDALGSNGQFAAQRTMVELSTREWREKERLIAIYRSQARALRAAFGPTWSSRERMGAECYSVVLPQNLECLKISQRSGSSAALLFTRYNL